VLIFVTETFTDAERVKSDGGHKDEFPVVKLNDVRDFQTGIYDYNAMTSTFVRLDGGLPQGVPTKVAFSEQEWCGHVFVGLWVDPVKEGARWRRTEHSYFDGEADRSEDGDVPVGGVFADGMPILVRGLSGDLLSPGERKDVSWAPRAIDLRHDHKPFAWGRATIERARDAERVEVPAGAFDAWRTDARVEGGHTATWWVESAAPHRVVKWARDDGEEGVLTGTVRSTYWTQHDEGMERMRADLGLPIRTWP
jgi:hypothetical protein